MDLPIGGRAKDPGINTLIEAYAAARSARLEAVERVKRLQLVEDRATADLFDAMERVDLRSVKHDRLGTFALNDLAWPKVSDEETARAWALTEFPEAITINRSRLAVIVREALAGERDMPPGVDYALSRKISWRGGPKEASPDG
jgi:hypothetical protein